MSRLCPLIACLGSAFLAVPFLGVTPGYPQRKMVNSPWRKGFTRKVWTIGVTSPLTCRQSNPHSCLLWTSGSSG
ncbi:hypothetical protein EV363DRAFT_1309139, partial [Boletus edulis]